MLESDKDLKIEDPFQEGKIHFNNVPTLTKAVKIIKSKGGYFIDNSPNIIDAWPDSPNAEKLKTNGKKVKGPKKLTKKDKAKKLQQRYKPVV